MMQMPQDRMAQASVEVGMDAYPLLRVGAMRALARVLPTCSEDCSRCIWEKKALLHYLLHNGSEIVRRIASSNICASDTESMST